MSTRLFLIRHGESLWNAERRLQGQADPPLSVYGTHQAYALAEELSARPLAAVYCSPLSRARQTAAYIAAPHGLTPITVSGVQEIDLGSWQGLLPDELSPEMHDRYCAWRRRPASVSPPDGEALAAALSRVVPVVDALVARHGDATVALVTHSIIGRVLLCHLLGTDLEVVPRLKLKTGSITKLRLDRDGALLEQLGDTSHLRVLSATTGAEERASS